MTVRALLTKLKLEGKTSPEIAKQLNVSQAMLSTYRQQNYMPSLTTARKIYTAYQEVIYPFSFEAVSTKGYGHEFD